MYVCICICSHECVYVLVSVLKTQSQHPSVSHCGGEDHHAAGNARQGQHFCTEGMICTIAPACRQRNAEKTGGKHERRAYKQGLGKGLTSEFPVENRAQCVTCFYRWKMGENTSWKPSTPYRRTRGLLTSRTA